MIRRQIELLELLQVQTDFMPASFFSKKLNISSKTIYNYLRDMEVVAKGMDLEIVRSPRHGIKLHGSDQAIEALMSSLQKEKSNDVFSPMVRRLRLLKMLFVEGETSTLEKLSTEYLVSKTSLYNDLDYLQSHMKSNLSIVHGTHGMELVGSELHIQMGLKNVLVFLLSKVKEGERRKILDGFFEVPCVNLVHRLLYQDYAELTDSLSTYYVESLVLTMIIQMVRLQKGFHIVSEDDFMFNNIRYMETYVVANSIVGTCKNELAIEYNMEDIEYLSKQLFAHRMTNSIRSNNQDYARIVRDVIMKMSELEKVNLNQDEHLYRSLLYHIPAMVLRLKKGILVENPLLENIKNHYIELFTVVWYGLSSLEKEFNITLNEVEVSLILIHFQIALEKVVKANNIVIVCPYGTSSSQLILSRLKQVLPSKDNIEIATLSKLKEMNRSNIDLIVSTVEIALDNIPFVKVSPLVDDEDYLKIMDHYRTHLIKKHRNHAKAHSLSAISAPVMKQYLRPELIHMKMKVQNKEECLDQMITKLETQGYVSEHYRDSILQREVLGVTSIDSGCALPHADPITVRTSCVSIATLEHKIKWGGNEVGLVIMVCFSALEAEHFKDLIGEIYGIISNKHHVDAMVQFRHREDFLHLVSK